MRRSRHICHRRWHPHGCLLYTSVDIGAVAAESLPDVSGMTFDNALSRKERISRFLQTVKNPYCFCIGGVGVKIEFADVYKRQL